MAVDTRHMAGATVPLWREIVAVRRMVAGGIQLARGEASTFMGGALAIVAVIGLVVLAALGRAIPAELGIIAVLAAGWYFSTATPAVVGALRRRGETPADAADSDQGHS